MTYRDTNKLTHHCLYLTILADYWSNFLNPLWLKIISKILSSISKFNVPISDKISTRLLFYRSLKRIFLAVPLQTEIALHKNTAVLSNVFFFIKRQNFMFQCAVHLTQALRICAPVPTTYVYPIISIPGLISSFSFFFVLIHCSQCDDNNPEHADQTSTQHFILICIDFLCC